MKHFAWSNVDLLIALIAFTAPAFARDAAWKEIDKTSFGVFDTLQRCQGIATDQQGNFWYSGNFTLIRTEGVDGFSRGSNTDAIPDELKHLGANHIGDIEFVQGFIFAPIEDGSDYKNPYVGIYTAEDLQAVKILHLSQQWQPDGVPWVAVDLENQALISSQYAQAERINIYDLETGKPRRQIQTSMTLNSVQGGKYWKDHLYMTAGDPVGGFAVFDMNLGSGFVQKLFHLSDELSEVEGLTLIANSNSATALDTPVSEFYVLGVRGHGFGRRMVLYHWKR